MASDEVRDNPKYADLSPGQKRRMRRQEAREKARQAKAEAIRLKREKLEAMPFWKRVVVQVGFPFAGVAALILLFAVLLNAGILVIVKYETQPMDFAPEARTWAEGQHLDPAIRAVAAGGPRHGMPEFDVWHQGAYGKWIGETDRWTYYFADGAGYRMVTVSQGGVLWNGSTDALPAPFATGKPIDTHLRSMKQAFSDQWVIRGPARPSWGLVIADVDVGHGTTWIYCDDRGIHRQLEESTDKVKQSDGILWQMIEEKIQPGCM